MITEFQEKLNEKLDKQLNILVAKGAKPISYTKMAKKIGINFPRHYTFGEAMFSSVKADVKNKRPIRASLICRESAGKIGMPGPGYFEALIIEKRMRRGENEALVWHREMARF